MAFKPRSAPPFEAAAAAAAAVTAVAAQRPRFQNAVTFRPRTTTTTRARWRERSRSRDSRPSEKHRQSRRNKALLGVILSVFIFLAVFSLCRHRQRQHVAEEAPRLRREVRDLEEALLRKKSLLGMAPGSPLGGRNAGRGAGGRGSDTQPVGYGGWHLPSLRHEEAQPPSPAERFRLGGDEAASPPLRASLELQPGLIREPVPLIIGGTDGSGTRGVVALLQRLRVPMVVEDRGTMDVHGSPYMVQGGWPAVVRPVIEWARGAGYEPRTAPDGLRRSTFAALDGLKAQMQKLANRQRPAVGGEAARYVSWGFKAPVSMMLVPFFEEAWGKAKFLHVVRDGRDIAFSGNQTPVEKYYAGMFPGGSRESGLRDPALKAMALWDRWNVGVNAWAAAQKERSGGAGGMDYLLLHAEDLIDPAAKFAAIKDVAEFVGSTLSDAELCCIANENSKDMGSHTTSRKDRGKVTNRFGKWKGKVEGNPGLSKALHDEGSRGLRLFGYEPERSLRASGSFQCAAERDPTCPKPPPTGAALRASRYEEPIKRHVETPAVVKDTDVCVGLVKDVDFHGFDLKVGHFEEHLECCQECRRVSGCSFFTFDYTSGVCYLKSGKGAETPKWGLISGMGVQPLVV